MSDPVVYVEQQFKQLKSFMRRQPDSWEPTGNAVVDAANRVRFQLKDTAIAYAYVIRTALRYAAEIYKMNPDHPRVTIHHPSTPHEHVDARQQQRIVELVEEFNRYIQDYGIHLKDGCMSLDDEKKLTAAAAPAVPAVELKWYFHDKNDVRQGPVSDEQLKMFVKRGIVTPESILETTNGHRGKAGQVKGLFDAKTMQAPDTVAASSNSLSGDIPALRTNSVTSTDTSQKSQILFGIGLLCLIPIVLAWAAVGLELLLNNTMNRWGATAMFCSMIFGVPAVICLYKAAVEKIVGWSACPKCGMLKANKLISREETNQRRTHERRLVDDQWKNVPVICYTAVFHYQCPFCNHSWEEKMECQETVKE